MSKNMPEVSIVGGGIIGVTMGVLLNIHGFKTRIYSSHLLDTIHPFDISQRPPELASIHAAASIIPHSVKHPQSTRILDISQKFFHCLAFSGSFGVRMQRHYELFETPVAPPHYQSVLKGFQLLSEKGDSWEYDSSIPKRNGAKGIWGWYFNTFFAESSTYLDCLYKLYKTSGGSFIHTDVSNKEEIENLPGDIKINATGRSAVELFPEDKPQTTIVRGHMVRLPIYEIPYDARNQYFSYNYTPDKSVYSRMINGEKKSADVYFYPRSDGWLIGGSRQEGFPAIGEPWREKDEQISGEVYKKPNWKHEIPKPVWDLNRELIKTITNPKIDIGSDKYDSFSYVGYRFCRDPIRIERDLENPSIYHNYGHGGAGYTLSWGSAYHLLELILHDYKIKPCFKKRELTPEKDLAFLSILEDLIIKLHESS